MGQMCQMFPTKSMPTLKCTGGDKISDIGVEACEVIGSSSARMEPRGTAAVSAAEWKKLPERSRNLEPASQHTFRPQAPKLSHTPSVRFSLSTYSGFLRKTINNKTG